MTLTKKDYMIVLCALSLGGCLCQPPGGESLEEFINLARASEEKRIIPTTTTTLETEVITLHRIRYNIMNIPVNLTAEALNNIKNMRFGGNSAAQSHGFYKCKTQVMEWFDIKTPQFSEAISVLPDWYNARNDSCIPIKNDNWTEYIDFNMSIWYVDRNTTKWLRLRLT